MSDIVKDRAVVLKTFEYGESSVVAVALTRSHGKLRFLAKGARRPKSPLYGALRAGSVCDTVFYFRADGTLQLLKECDSSETYATAEKDLERLCLFQAGLEIIDRSVVGRDCDERLFDLIEGFMRLLPSAEDPWVLFYAFEIGVLSLAGFLPSIESCARCSRPLAGAQFGVDPTNGVVTCAACGRAARQALSVRASGTFERLIREGFAAAAVPVAREERREIGRLIHNLFAGHIEGYRLPNALRLCTRERNQ